MYEVEIREAERQDTAAVRGGVAREELGSWLAATHGTIAMHLQRIGVQTIGLPYAVVERDGERLHVEAGIPVAEIVDGKDEVQPGELPGGQQAATWHQGSFEDVDAAYEALELWGARTGVEFVGTPYQVVHGDPEVSPDGESWQIEVVQPFREA